MDYKWEQVSVQGKGGIIPGKGQWSSQWMHSMLPIKRSDSLQSTKSSYVVNRAGTGRFGQVQRRRRERVLFSVLIFYRIYKAKRTRTLEGEADT